MLQNPNNQGKNYCNKCLTYYGSAETKCPFCGAVPEVTKSQAPKGPSQTDLKLVSLLRTLSDQQKEQIIMFIENHF